jgi:hypothetical protein
MGLDIRMKGDKIPDQHHITRYCQPKYILDGQIQPGAFKLRASEESLSVNWLEFLNCPSRGSEITEVRNIYSTKFKSVGARAKTAILNVGEVRKKILEESPDRRKLEVLHDPAPEMNDPSHSGIYNLIV